MSQVRLVFTGMSDEQARDLANTLADRYLHLGAPYGLGPWTGARVEVVSDEDAEREAVILKAASYLMKAPTSRPGG